MRQLEVRLHGRSSAASSKPEKAVDSRMRPKSRRSARGFPCFRSLCLQNRAHLGSRRHRVGSKAFCRKGSGETIFAAALVLALRTGLAFCRRLGGNARGLCRFSPGNLRRAMWEDIAKSVFPTLLKSYQARLLIFRIRVVKRSEYPSGGFKIKCALRCLE